MPSIDSLNTRKDLKVGDKTYQYYSLPAAEAAGLAGSKVESQFLEQQPVAARQGQAADR